MKHIKLLAMILAITTLMTLTTVLIGCHATPEGSQNTETNTQTDSETESTPTVNRDLNVHVMVLNGTTGFGMAQLMDKNAKGEASLTYDFAVESDASIITAAL